MSIGVLAKPGEGVATPGLRRRVVLVLVIAVMMLISFLLGTRQSPKPNVLTGNAIVGTSVVTVVVNGWAYGFAKGVTWFGSDGEHHDRGLPGCLTKVGSTAPIQFGWVTAPGPDGSALRQVTWVKCTT